MENSNTRRPRPALTGGLAALAMVLGLAAVPAGAAPPAKLAYVSVGDSYSAGTGAGVANNPGSACWQSSPGYVDDVGRTGRVSLVANAACHGALLSGGSATSVRNQIAALATPTAGSPTPALNSATGLVSITAGANDVGVYQVLSVCATSSSAQCSAAVALSGAALPGLRAGLTATYLGLKQVAPNARIAVLGYPRLFDPANGFPVIPPTNQIILNQATDQLNASIAAAVGASRAAGVDAQFVDVTDRFAGHAANSRDPWLVLDQSNPTADYNFHPTSTGYDEGYKSAIMGSVKPAQLAKK
ncbi:MAG: SGNH/GDSL hydrolase family protein [Arthrobacter oryzae]